MAGGLRKAVDDGRLYPDMANLEFIYLKKEPKAVQ